MRPAILRTSAAVKGRVSDFPVAVLCLCAKAIDRTSVSTIPVAYRLRLDLDQQGRSAATTKTDTVAMKGASGIAARPREGVVPGGRRLCRTAGGDICCGPLTPSPVRQERGTAHGAATRRRAEAFTTQALRLGMVRVKRDRWPRITFASRPDDALIRIKHRGSKCGLRRPNIREL